MNETVRKAIFKKVSEEPFAKKFGLRLIEIQEGFSKVEMVSTPDMENMFGMTHGGALFALIDEAFEIASNSHGTMAVALNMNVNYMASPAKDSKLTAEAKEINKTQKTAAYNIIVTDDKNNLIASCQSIVYRMEKPLPFLKKHV
jgi:acyl-CoA thioesterase